MRTVEDLGHLTQLQKAGVVYGMGMAVIQARSCFCLYGDGLSDCKELALKRAGIPCLSPSKLRA